MAMSITMLWDQSSVLAWGTCLFCGTDWWNMVDWRGRTLFESQESGNWRCVRKGHMDLLWNQDFTSLCCRLFGCWIRGFKAVMPVHSGSDYLEPVRDFTHQACNIYTKICMFQNVPTAVMSHVILMESEQHLVVRCDCCITNNTRFVMCCFCCSSCQPHWLSPSFLPSKGWTFSSFKTAFSFHIERFSSIFNHQWHLIQLSISCFWWLLCC